MHGRRRWAGRVGSFTARARLLGVLVALTAVASTLGGVLGSGMPVREDSSRSAFVPSTAVTINRTVGWTNVSTLLSDDDIEPAPCAMSGAAFDPTESGAVFFGGLGPGDVVANSTWVFMGGEDEWLGVGTHAGLGSASGPPPLEHAGEAYDVADGYLLMFGGTEANGSAYDGEWAFGGNTWANLSWTNLGAATVGSPGPVAWPMMTYDSLAGFVLLYTGTSQNSTWEYAHGVWQPVPVATAPPARTAGALTYDATDDEVVLFGGMSAGPTPTPLDDTWTFADGNWTMVHTAVAPPAMPWVAATYDAAAASVALVGGGAMLQTWMFADGAWSNVTAVGPNIPEGLTGFSIAYQPLDGWVMLFGGETWGTTPAALNNDVWGWDFPPQPSYNGLTASPLSTDTWIAIVLVATLPVLGAILWTRWPRRPAVSDVTLPNAEPSSRAEPSGNG